MARSASERILSDPPIPLPFYVVGPTLFYTGACWYWIPVWHLLTLAGHVVLLAGLAQVGRVMLIWYTGSS